MFLVASECVGGGVGESECSARGVGGFLVA